MSEDLKKSVQSCVKYILNPIEWPPWDKEMTEAWEYLC